MIHGWDEVAALSEEVRKTSGIYARLANDGEKLVGALAGMPCGRLVHWVGVSYDECTGQGCELCAEGSKPSMRVACNIYVFAERAMKIVEGTRTWFDNLQKTRRKYGPHWAYEITRNGAAGSPKTTYSILPEFEMSTAQKAEVAAAKLHDLESEAAAAAREAYSEDEAQPAPAAPATQPDGATISVEVARELHERLRLLPRVEVAAFFAKFGVDRVSRLKAADEHQARLLLEAPQDDLPF